MRHLLSASMVISIALLISPAAFTQTSSGTNGTAKNSSALKPGEVHPDAKYIDAESLGNFSGGAAVITKGASTALIDAKGNFIVPYNKYMFMDDPLRLNAYEVLMDGIFRFNNSNYTPGGFMNAKGKIIETGHLHQITSNNKLLAGREDNKWSYITAEGKKYNYPVEILEVSENIGSVRNSGYKIGYRQLGGEILTDFIFDDAASFSDGMARVGKRNEFGEVKYGYINKQGKLVIPFSFSNGPGDFNSGFARVVPKDKSEFEYAFINKKGEVVLKQTQADIDKYGVFQSFTKYGLAFNTRNVLDSTMKIISKKDFLAAFGLTGDVQLLNEVMSVANETSPKLFFTQISAVSPHTQKSMTGFINLRTRKVVAPVFDVGDANRLYFDPVSHLTYARVATGNNNNGVVYREGYINEDGVFVIVKNENSKW
jgi:hypothetical protein